MEEVVEDTDRQPTAKDVRTVVDKFIAAAEPYTQDDWEDEDDQRVQQPTPDRLKAINDAQAACG